MKKLTLTYILLAIMLHSGCKKLLDKDPVDKISIEDTFSDFEGARAALLGVYSAFYNTTYYNGKRSAYPDVIGGNIKYSKTGNVDLYDEYNLATTAAESDMNATYQELYGILNNINYIIEKVPAIADGTVATRNRLIAEATVLRALIHFDLVQLYAQPYGFTTDASHLGISINLEPFFVNATQIKRSTVKETYDAIIADLKSAAVMFPGTSVVYTVGSTANYANLNTVHALLARVYLSKGDWQNAYTAANAVISNRAYTLFSNENYVASWMVKNTTESIFEISAPNSFGGNSYGSYFDISTGNNYLQMATTDDLLNLYTSTDVRGRSSFYNQFTVNGNKFYFCKKYATSNALATGVKVIRLSEIYLIRAEAAAELGNNVQANADLNVIRRRGDTSAAPLNLTTKNELTEAILLERRKELNLEGFLLFDLGRRKKNIIRTDCTAITCNLNYPEAHYVLPIPEVSVLSNFRMIQNPSY